MGLSNLTEKQQLLALSAQSKFRKCVVNQAAPSSNLTVSTGSKALSVAELVVKLENLSCSHQYSNQLLLMDHEYVRKKFINSANKKKGLIVDIRLVSGEKGDNALSKKSL
ncbi:unnamed protein product [Caenorhabditis nigoni]